ncbi:MAG: type I methionyl aminopeptidase [Defluviitaleaceae bacterium]|nr:type I methionyl aminopeptidase [Defluviitaleaceae bacterium]
MIIIKSNAQVQLMRKAGQTVMRTFELLERYIKPGVTTLELDKIAYDFIKSKGGYPSFLGYQGYPASINTSVNEEIVHGVPSLRKLKSGDIVGIDIGVYLNGVHGDAARTYGIGEISAENQHLIDVTRQCFFEAIKYARPKNHLNQICSAIESYANSHGYTVSKEFIGHGIGANLHEPPDIPNNSMEKRGPRIRQGMTFAIEPMVNAGASDAFVEVDGWTGITKDKKNSAHYENTILITDGEPEILTV